MQTTQLNHVALHVRDVDRSRQFYSDVLLLRSLPRPAFSFPGAWFQLGIDQELHLIGDRERAVVSASRGNHYALMVDDMDAWESHLKDAGIDYGARRTRPDGAFQVFFQDPDGHTIELCTPPSPASDAS